MTLNLTIVNSWGIWQCSDGRLVDLSTRKVTDDYSVKHVTLRCPDGVALIAYAGIGRMDKDVEISDWIREILRGPTRTIDESLLFLRDAASSDLGPPLCGRHHHMFTVGIFLGGQPWLAQIRNFECPSPHSYGPPVREFRTVAERVPVGGRVSTFGAQLSERDWSLLVRVVARRPRKPAEFLDLLAAINTRTAAMRSTRGTVSRHCLATYAPRNGGPLKSIFYAASGPPSPQVPPLLLFGIDTTDLQAHTLDLLGNVRDGTQAPSPQPGLPNRAIISKNRLRRR